ncbi:MAG: HNH endonuclease [Deltaproteobacteria bacterium]|nr:HNH endonuclease [Deltaproteobacteria bacterium]
MQYQIKLKRNAGISRKELIEDLLMAARKQKTDTLSMAEYKRIGKFSPNAYKRAFGSWNKALQHACLRITKRGNNAITEQELLRDLKSVSKKLNKSSLTMDEYEKVGQYDRGYYKRKFGGWNKALSEAGINIRKRGNNTITNDELFHNLASVWEKLKKQPSQNDLDGEESDFYAMAYKKKFGTYNKALIAFGEWVEGVPITEERGNRLHDRKRGQNTKREIGIRLRFKILKRDYFRCKICGTSPAKDPKVELEVDHIVPWAKGGETVPDNLQTLCSRCNRGKSSL